MERVGLGREAELLLLRENSGRRGLPAGWH